MIAADASALIALFDSDDAHHGPALALFDEHGSSGFRVHELTLAEVLVGAVRVGRGIQLWDELVGMGATLHASDANDPLLLAELRASTGLKLPDCCVLVAARSGGLPLATFDDRLAAAAKSMGLVVLR